MMILQFVSNSKVSNFMVSNSKIKFNLQFNFRIPLSQIISIYNYTNQSQILIRLNYNSLQSFLLSNLLNNISFLKYSMGISKSSTSQDQKVLQKLKLELQAKDKLINNLKKEHQTLIKQIIPSNRLTKQYTIDSLMHINYQMFTCLLCQNFFDQTKHVPIMVCKNQHTICQICSNTKEKQNKKKCFNCTEVFKNYGKNRSILHLISNKQDLLNWVKQRDAGKQEKIEFKQMQFEAENNKKIEVHLCKFLNYQTMFEMNGDSVLKISPEASWHTIRCSQHLSGRQLSEISLKVINSVHNSLIVGVTSQIQQFQKGFIPSSSVAFHLNNGHIYDQRAVNEFKWRNGGVPVIKNTNPRMIITVDPASKIVRWKIQNKVCGQAKIPQKFVSSPLYVFLAIYHKGDLVVFNK